MSSYLNDILVSEVAIVCMEWRYRAERAARIGALEMGGIRGKVAVSRN